jgi:hypothetical protein
MQPRTVSCFRDADAAFLDLVGPRLRPPLPTSVHSVLSHSLQVIAFEKSKDTHCLLELLLFLVIDNVKVRNASLRCHRCATFDTQYLCADLVQYTLQVDGLGTLDGQTQCPIPDELCERA